MSLLLLIDICKHKNNMKNIRLDLMLRVLTLVKSHTLKMRFRCLNNVFI